MFLVGDRLAVLIDQVERSADRRGAGRAAAPELAGGVKETRRGRSPARQGRPRQPEEYATCAPSWEPCSILYSEARNEAGAHHFENTPRCHSSSHNPSVAATSSATTTSANSSPGRDRLGVVCERGHLAPHSLLNPDKADRDRWQRAQIATGGRYPRLPYFSQ